MGLAIFFIGFYHAPFIIHDTWKIIFHDSLNMGVDLFLLLSGLGACHSISARGGKGYLLQRAKRLLPGLYLFVVPWCVVMYGIGSMSLAEFLGNITFLGWWFGLSNQLNWYFSGVWLFFLLAIPLWKCFSRTKHPVLLWAVLVVLSLGFGILWPADYYMVVISRLPIFITGMLFGTLEMRGMKREWLLRTICYCLLPVGILLVDMAYLGYGYYFGYTLGMWWYPYAFVVCGGALLVSDVAALLRRWKPFRLAMRPMERLGESSSEALMVHIGIYKVIFLTTRFSNRWWLCIWLGTMVLGVAYHYLIEYLTHRKKKAA